MVVCIAAVDCVVALEQIAGGSVSILGRVSRRLEDSPTSKAHVACEALEGFHISVCSEGQQGVAKLGRQRVGLTGEDMALEMLVPGEGLAAVGAENHVGGGLVRQEGRV